MSLSGCLPNLVMWIPRIQTSSCTHRVLLVVSVAAGRFEAEADGLGAVVVGAERVRRQADLHARRHVVGIGLDVDQLPRTGVPSQSTTADTNGTGMPGAAKATIVNVGTVPSVATSTCLKSVPKHEAQALRRSKYRAPQDGALVGHEVRAGRRAPGSRREGSVRSSGANATHPADPTSHRTGPGSDGMSCRSAGTEILTEPGGTVARRERAAVPHRVRCRRPAGGHDARPAQRRSRPLRADRHRAPRRRRASWPATAASTPSSPTLPGGRAGRVRDQRDGRAVDEHRRQRARAGRDHDDHPRSARAGRSRTTCAPARS